MAQNLLGCEAVADVNCLDCVYGIVTDYLNWIFFRSLNDSIERSDIEPLISVNGEPDRQSLGIVLGKIYALLSD